MGGECNYLLRIDSTTKQLAFIPDEAWKSPLMMSWSEADISKLLDTAQQALKQAASQLCMDVEVRSAGPLTITDTPAAYPVDSELSLIRWCFCVIFLLLFYHLLPSGEHC